MPRHGRAYLDRVGSSHKQSPGPFAHASWLPSKAHCFRTRTHHLGIIEPFGRLRTVLSSRYTCMTPFEAEADLVRDYGGGHSFLLSDKPLRNILKPRLIFSAAHQGARRRCRAAFLGLFGLFLLFFLMTLSIITLCNRSRDESYHRCA